MVPVSLIISLDIVKMAQSYFINVDKLMYSSARKQGSIARCASLNEELGQV